MHWRSRCNKGMPARCLNPSRAYQTNLNYYDATQEEYRRGKAKAMERSNFSKDDRLLESNRLQHRVSSSSILLTE